MLNSDLDYVYIAPVSHWRGGRFYTEAHAQTATPQMGHAEAFLAPIIEKRLPVKLLCDTIPVMTKQIIPVRVKRVNRMRAPRG